MAETSHSQTRVGFIGLGKMGLPMALNLHRKGFAVTGFDLSQAAREALVVKGAQAAETAALACRGAQVIVTMLPTSKIVTQTLVGDGNALADVSAGTIILDMSSSVPADTQALGRILSERGMVLIDAPVSGGVVKAIDGTLAIMAGGDVPEIAKAVLAAMSATIFYTGVLGSGHAMKALNNYVSAAGAAAAVEALLAARAFGIDEALVTDILNASTGRNNTTEIKVKKFMLSGAYNSGFGLGLMAKDVAIAAEMGTELGLDLPLLSETSALWSRASAALPAGADHTEIYRYLDLRNTDQTKV